MNLEIPDAPGYEWHLREKLFKRRVMVSLYYEGRYISEVTVKPEEVILYARALLAEEMKNQEIREIRRNYGLPKREVNDGK